MSFELAYIPLCHEALKCRLTHGISRGHIPHSCSPVELVELGQSHRVRCSGKSTSLVFDIGMSRLTWT